VRGACSSNSDGIVAGAVSGPSLHSTPKPVQSPVPPAASAIRALLVPTASTAFFLLTTISKARSRSAWFVRLGECTTIVRADNCVEYKTSSRGSGAAAAAAAAMTASTDTLQQLGESVRADLADAHTYVFFDDSGRVLASSFKASLWRWLCDDAQCSLHPWCDSMLEHMHCALMCTVHSAAIRASSTSLGLHLWGITTPAHMGPCVAGQQAGLMGGYLRLHRMRRRLTRLSSSRCLV
jgi:hypothetical protein